MEETSNNRYKHKIYQVLEREECKWARPKEGYVRVDVDGSVDSRRNAACDGVIRDDQGKWLCGFQQNLGFIPSTTTELQAICIGLQVAKQSGFKKVQLFTDSIQAVQLLMNDHGNFHPIGDVIDRARLLIFSNWDLEISFSHREALKCADLIAEKAHQSNFSNTLLQDPPPECLELLVNDLL
ncbi:uncharacterized protein LOC114717361 [Neltuma alba]|uniref:uncharacterized protein LOC114717361 n=1 Tax=Neltuma alba TaxID=207710 RepID=UPI0010A57480|nr:uncharacterized protein LOC114717361 [Prosopis alba]